MNKIIKLRFKHGLGDCSNAAHLLQLWRRRGYEISLHSDLNKEPLFRAAGIQFNREGDHTVHPWSHPPEPGPPKLGDSWFGNKTGWNLNQPPLPHIGTLEDLWPELCSVRLTLAPIITEAERTQVDALTKDLCTPLVLLHTRGNTGQVAKNLTADLEEDIYSALLERTPATLVLLDWDRRVPRCHRWRVRHLEEEAQSLSLGALWLLMERASCLVGVDSGPLHFARCCGIPVIGLWIRHHPAHYALPSDRAIHLVESGNPFREWNSYRRHSFGVVEVPRHSGSEVAKWVSRILDPELPRLCTAVGPELVLQSLIDKCQHRQPGPNGYCDRHRTFPLFMRQAQRCSAAHSKNGPQIVSTGSIRQVEDWTAGYSDYLFGYWLSQVNGCLRVVELDPKRAEFARSWTSPFPVVIETAHSHEFLGQYDGPRLDGFYSDSADTTEPGHSECCLTEVQLALRHLRPEAPILIDDTYYGAKGWHGKGSLAIPYLLSQGWRMFYSGHQSLLVRT